MDFLSEIVAVKKRRVAAAKAVRPLEQMREFARKVSKNRGHKFAEAISRPRGVNVIAEFKRRSPSKGKIAARADALAMAQIYQSAGAAAISCLTEEDYFEGSLSDLRSMRQPIWLPTLRKDFIVDEYQIYETAPWADALLLIVAALDDATLARLREIAEDELGLDALVEVHTVQEFKRACDCGARLIGVNNRDLQTFEVSLDTSKSLAVLARPDTILVSESGLSPADIPDLRAAGYQAFLVGETLMRADDPAKALREFVNQPEEHRPRSVWVKICGITSAEDARAAVQAGADMLGFNFYPPSPRFIEVDAAAEIIRNLRSEMKDGQSSRVDKPLRPSTIGVFVNESIKQVARTTERAGLDGVQLHGDETLAYCTKLREALPRNFLIKAARLQDETNLEALSAYPVDAFMIDAVDDRLRGGTGRVANWELARRAAEHLPRLFLAGGLSPENVSQAIATVRPYAVDACSALETEPGRKNSTRMKEFVDAVRSSKLPDEISIVGEGN
jgi:indole-3-glycerol phosphate synthase/phosphoribosylanthranilate isomerase